jgi:ABC-type antimicrobial peptide transport system permease subunit
MLRSYFKIALRNIWRSKGFSFINMTGLAVGMASATLILLWIYNEVSYDRFHKNKDSLYEVWNRGTFDGEIQCWNFTPKILGPTLKQEYRDIDATARTFSRWFVTIAGEKKISTKALVADPAFLTMFTFPFQQGDPKTALNDATSIVITSKMAKKMFDTEDALNKMITIDRDNFTVTGILKDLPINSTFDFEYILPYSYLVKRGDDDTNWAFDFMNTYVQLAPGANALDVEAKIKNITKDHTNGREQKEVFLHPLTKWHLYSKFENGKLAGGRIETVTLFGFIAMFILLIACINFMNLSTARSEKRAKEVGVRKTAGANRGLLVVQFLGESMLLVFLAAVLAVVLVQVSLPSFDVLVNKELFVPFDNVYFWLIALIFIVLTGLIAGSYPAFFLSSFKPIAVLKGTFKKLNASVNPRKVLVVLQFSFAIVLIICTLVVVQQIRYTQHRDTGYDKGPLVYHWMTGDLYKNYAPLRNELLAAGVVAEVTKTNSTLTDGFGTTYALQWQGKDPNDKTAFDVLTQDQNLVRTAGLKLTQGRDIDLANYPADSSAILLNESAVKAIGFQDPLGQRITNDMVDYQVVGVIKDFVFGSPSEQVKPMVIFGSKADGFNVINMKLTDSGATTGNLKTIQQLFEKYNPELPFEFHFVDEDYARKFDDIQRIGQMTALFTGLTVLIACLGLFGLATYMAETRIKEIGVRKVLGASVFRITVLLSKDFLSLVMVAVAIGSPIAWYIMQQWLQRYSYNIGLHAWVFVMAAVGVLLLSLLTISYQALRAAMANPVKSLKTE